MSESPRSYYTLITSIRSLIPSSSLHPPFSNTTLLMATLYSFHLLPSSAFPSLSCPFLFTPSILSLCLIHSPSLTVSACPSHSVSLPPHRLRFLIFSPSRPPVVVIHASLRLRNLKNKVENKLESIGLKRSPMGLMLEALGQEQEAGS